MGDADYWRPGAHDPGSPMAAIAARFDQLERTLAERQVEVDALRLRVAVLERWRNNPKTLWRYTAPGFNNDENKIPG